MPLDGKQRRRLRALGHHLQPVVRVGEKGVTPSVVEAARQALADHELVKVKLEGEREERQEALEALASGTGAEVAQVLGKTALLFKLRAKKSKLAKLLLGKPAPAEEAEAGD